MFSRFFFLIYFFLFVLIPKVFCQSNPDTTIVKDSSALIREHSSIKDTLVPVNDTIVKLRADTLEIKEFTVWFYNPDYSSNEGNYRQGIIKITDTAIVIKHLVDFQLVDLAITYKRINKLKKKAFIKNTLELKIKKGEHVRFTFEEKETMEEFIAAIQDRKDLNVKQEFVLRGLLYSFSGMMGILLILTLSRL